MQLHVLLKTLSEHRAATIGAKLNEKNKPVKPQLPLKRALSHADVVQKWKHIRGAVTQSRKRMTVHDNDIFV